MAFHTVAQAVQQPRPLDDQQGGGEQQQAGELHVFWAARKG
jgi:hypothetical protein